MLCYLPVRHMTFLVNSYALQTDVNEPILNGILYRTRIS